MIRRAKRPVVLAGLQCRGEDSKWLRALVEALPAPVLTTYKAKGAVPDPHPLALGVFTSGALEEPVVSRADLIITFGLDTVELIPRRWGYTAPVLSLVRAPSQGYFSPAHEVVGELGVILEELAPRLQQHHADWDVVEVERLRRGRQRALEIRASRLAPHRICHIARQMTPAAAIATVHAVSRRPRPRLRHARADGHGRPRLRRRPRGLAGCLRPHAHRRPHRRLRVPRNA